MNKSSHTVAKRGLLIAEEMIRALDSLKSQQLSRSGEQVRRRFRLVNEIVFTAEHQAGLGTVREKIKFNST